MGLSNPLRDHKPQQQQQQQLQSQPQAQQQQHQQISESEITPKVSNDNITNRSTRPHGVVIESTVIQSSVDSAVTNPQVVSNPSEIVRNTRLT